MCVLVSSNLLALFKVWSLFFSLLDVIAESKALAMAGVPLPEVARLILAQVHTHTHRHKHTHTLCYRR